MILNVFNTCIIVSCTETRSWFSVKLHIFGCGKGGFKHWFNYPKGWVCPWVWQEKPSHGPTTCAERYPRQGNAIVIICSILIQGFFITLHVITSHVLTHASFSSLFIYSNLWHWFLWRQRGELTLWKIGCAWMSFQQPPFTAIEHNRFDDWSKLLFFDVNVNIKPFYCEVICILHSNWN